jgi:hypothetical protein
LKNLLSHFEIIIKSCSFTEPKNNSYVQEIWFSVKLVFIFAPRKTFFYTRNLLRKVEGIDPAKPWQPANRNESKVPNSTPKFGKDKSEISLK